MTSSCARSLTHPLPGPHARSRTSSLLRLLLLACLFAFIPSAFAQAKPAANPGPCTDPWISTALHQFFPSISGSGTTGECAPTRFGNGTWGTYSGSQQMLTNWVSASRLCNDPWIGEAYVNATGRKINGAGTSGECNPALYGSWGTNFPQLIANVKTYQAKLAATPAAPAKLTLKTVNLVSAMGAKCLGFANGTHTPGTQAILWNCGTTADQTFVFTRAGEIRAFAGSSFSDAYNGKAIGNLCLDVTGGIIAAGRVVMIWPCNGQPNQKWSLRQGQLNTATNYNLCLAITGGWVGFQVTQLAACNQQPSQRFRWGIAATPGRSTNPIPSGTQTTIGTTINTAAVISNDGGSLISDAGGNIISQDGNGIVAQGGGNIVAQGGGNVVVPGGDTISTGN